MKLSIAIYTFLPLLTTAHTIAQRVRYACLAILPTPSAVQLMASSVNGVDNGEIVGIRTALSNNPIQNVNEANIACNFDFNFKQPVSTKVIPVKGGDRVGVLWGHVIGGAQFAGDPDQPIAKSHKGPTLFYMYDCPSS